jgi:DNA-binding CsgD family transcriptional regulator
LFPTIFVYQLKKFFPFIIFCFCCINAQAQYEFVFKQPYPQRANTIDSLYSGSLNNWKTDSVDIMSATLKKLAKAANDEKALLQIQLGLVAVNRIVGEVKNYDILKASVDSIIAIAKKTNNNYILAGAYTQKAYIYLDTKQYTAMFDGYLNMVAIVKDLTETEYRGRNYSLYSAAYSFYRFNDYEKAIFIAKEVQPSKVEYNTITLTYDLIASAFLKLDEFDSSRLWFNKTFVYTTAPHRENPEWQGILNGNIGYSWYLQKEYDKAIPYLEKGLALTTATKIWDNATNFNCILADINLQQGNIAKANELLQNAKNIIPKNDDDNLYKLYSGLSNYYRKTGNTAQTLFYQDSMLFYKDKIATERSTNKKITAEFNFELEKRKQDEILLQAETNRQKWVRNFIISGLFAIMLLGLFYYNRQRTRQLYKQKQLINEKRIAEEELKIASVQLDDFTKSLKVKNNLIEKFTAEIEKLQALPCNIVTPEQTAYLNQIRDSAILTDDDWDDFRKRFEKVHSGFLERLKITLPDLSPAETRFIALAKLNLSNKEMAAMLGVSVDAMRTIRYRLRKKLHLSEEGDIQELVNKI